MEHPDFSKIFPTDMRGPMGEYAKSKYEALGFRFTNIPSSWVLCNVQYPKGWKVVKINNNACYRYHGKVAKILDRNCHERGDICWYGRPANYLEDLYIAHLYYVLL